MIYPWYVEVPLDIAALFAPFGSIALGTAVAIVKKDVRLRAIEIVGLSIAWFIASRRSLWLLTPFTLFEPLHRTDSLGVILPELVKFWTWKEYCWAAVGTCIAVFTIYLWTDAFRRLKRDTHGFPLD
jgi:hypothetical protein